MEKNIGKTDGIVRMLLGVAIALAGFYYRAWWIVLAAIPLATAYFGSCPLYKLFGINSCKKARS
jgi:hypothetical protein